MLGGSTWCCARTNAVMSASDDETALKAIALLLTKAGPVLGATNAELGSLRQNSGRRSARHANIVPCQRSTSGRG